jgi:hypothetical protein
MKAAHRAAFSSGRSAAQGTATRGGAPSGRVEQPQPLLAAGIARRERDASPNA